MISGQIDAQQCLLVALCTPTFARQRGREHSLPRCLFPSVTSVS